MTSSAVAQGRELVGRVLPPRKAGFGARRWPKKGGCQRGDSGIGPGPGGEGILSLSDGYPYPSPTPQLDAGTRGAKPAGPETGPVEMGTGSSGAGTVLQFFTRLRRHASLDGASPYFKVKKWKLEPSQRASSLDTRGKAFIPDDHGLQGPS